MICQCGSDRTFKIICQNLQNIVVSVNNEVSKGSIPTRAHIGNKSNLIVTICAHCGLIKGTWPIPQNILWEYSIDSDTGCYYSCSHCEYHHWIHLMANHDTAPHLTLDNLEVTKISPALNIGDSKRLDILICGNCGHMVGNWPVLINSDDFTLNIIFTGTSHVMVEANSIITNYHAQHGPVSLKFPKTSPLLTITGEKITIFMLPRLISIPINIPGCSFTIT